jgi:hypothetical protein
MDVVQAPIVPIIGDLIRQSPGTISLGQGVVHYGPPREAIEAARAALGDTRATIRVTGRRVHVHVRPRVVLPALADALAASATADAGPATAR